MKVQILGILEAFADFSRGVATRNRVGFDVLGNHRTCRDHAAFADSHSTQNYRSIANPDIVADSDLDVITLPVVVRVADLARKARGCADVPEVVIIATDERHHVRHNHAMPDGRVALDLAVSTDVAVVADLQLVRRPEDHAAPGVEASPQRILAPLHVHEVEVSQVLDPGDQRSMNAFHFDGRELPAVVVRRIR